ncbi:hypothetical protein [Pseudonocardia lacus]|uniref:hypothetical protein n=1 Tax=Pseudonocardia lacus TaxID=2835865 RepID=UPI001BDBC181|nr:hypothetical protein [Pseudonocardia lacus]
MRKFRELMRELFTPSIGGRAGRQSSRILRRAGAAGFAQAVLAVWWHVRISAVRLDQRAARTLTSLMDALDAARAADEVAAQRLAAVAAEPGRSLRAQEYVDRQRDRLSQRFDRTLPLVAARVLLGFEMVFGLAEFSFWYQVFTGDIDSSVPVWDTTRLMAGVLALLVPVAGIMAARWAGATAQRLRHLAPARAERISQVLAAALSVGLLVVVAFAVAALVIWRYGDAAVLDLLPVPGEWMAAVFVAIMIGDAVARAFLSSEQNVQDTARDRAYVADRKTEMAAAAAKTRTENAVRKAENALVMVVDVTMDRVEQVLGTGALIVLRERALAGVPLTPAGAAPAEPTTLPPMLDIVAEQVRLRALSTAVARLGKPAAGDRAVRIDQLLAVLHGLVRPEPPAAPDADVVPLDEARVSRRERQDTDDETTRAE